MTRPDPVRDGYPGFRGGVVSMDDGGRFRPDHRPGLPRPGGRRRVGRAPVPSPAGASPEFLQPVS